MRAAYFLILGLIGISPALLFVDGPITHALLVAYAAVAVALVGVLIRPGEAGHLAKIMRPIIIMAAIIALWLILQLIPLPIKSWANPIWADAETALGAPIAGRITIDPGATLVAICRYFSVLAILFAATAVTIDRMRAEQVLFWLVGATTVAAVVQIIHAFVAFEFLDEATNTAISVSTTALCALGVILAAAAVVRGIERYETRRSDADTPFAKFAIGLGPALAAFGICALSLVIFSRAPVGLAAACGLATLAVLMVVRRLSFGLWVGSAISAIAVSIAIIITIGVAETHAGSGDVMFRYASQAHSSLISTTKRIIADAGWPGTGGGTFEFLLPIYGYAVTVGLPAPTTAAQIAIELGRPALLAVLIMAILVIFLLLRGALQRGRDAFYPAAAAGCIVLLTLEAYCDAGLNSTAVLICTVAALGLGFAQRVSRATQ
jgi:hypothetical protein